MHVEMVVAPRMPTARMIARASRHTGLRSGEIVALYTMMLDTYLAEAAALLPL